MREVGVTQEEIGREFGRDRSSVSKILGGKVPLQLCHVPILAGLLRVDCTDILIAAGLPLDCDTMTVSQPQVQSHG